MGYKRFLHKCFSDVVVGLWALYAERNNPVAARNDPVIVTYTSTEMKITF